MGSWTQISCTAGRTNVPSWQANKGTPQVQALDYTGNATQSWAGAMDTWPAVEGVALLR